MNMQSTIDIAINHIIKIKEDIDFLRVHIKEYYEYEDWYDMYERLNEAEDCMYDALKIGKRIKGE